MQRLFLGGVLPVLDISENRSCWLSTTRYIFQWLKEIGDQNVVCELIAVIKASSLEV